MVGIILSWPQQQTEVQIREPGLAYFPKETTVIAWGDNGLLKPMPEASVWPNAGQALALHRRAFDKIGIPVDQVQGVAIGYSFNTNPVEMAMVIDGTFDASKLMESVLKGQGTDTLTLAGHPAVTLAKGFVLANPEPGRVVVGNASFVEKGLEGPRKKKAQDIVESMAPLPDGSVFVALLDTSFYMPGVKSARGAIGTNNGLWVTLKVECISPDTCSRFPDWLEQHLKSFTPGLTVNPDETNAFLSTVNLDMGENGGLLTAGSPPLLDP